MKLLKQIFTWWNGQTIGTMLFTFRKGEFVGQDHYGNKYYRAKSAVPQSIPERRWVIYSGYSEASQVPPGWHGWIHHRVDTPPAATDAKPHSWQKQHIENLTGTAAAYRPEGSIALGGKPKKQSKDYQAWQPE